MYSLYIWNHPSLFIVTNLGQELWTWKEKTWGFASFAQDSSPYSFLMIPLYFQRFKHGIWTSACVICSWSSSINHQTVRTCFVPHKHLRCSCCCVWDRLITVFCLLWDVYLSRSSFFFFWKRLSFLPHLSFSLLSEATLGWNSQATCQGREDHRKDTAHPSPRFISAPVVCVNKPIIRGMGFHKHIYKMRTCVLTEIWQSDSWTFWDLKAFANVGKIVIIRENLLPPDYENRWQKN